MRIMFVFVILVIQVIIFGGHYIAYRGIVDIFQIKNLQILLSLKIIFSILSVSFVIASLISSRFFSLFTQIFYSISAIWLGFLFYIVLACAVFLAVKFGISSFVSPYILKAFGSTLLGIGVLTGIYGIWNAQNIQVTKTEIAIQGIPNEWRGKTALWVSDIHFGQIYSTHFSERISKIIQNEHPDILFLGGDVFDGTASDIKNVLKPLTQIQTTLGTYFITGNHEEFSTDDTFVKAVQETNITVLQNKTIEINGINIIGVDYNDSENKEIFNSKLKTLVKSGEPNILLKHAPTNLDIGSNAGITLQISGHTHVAQMFPFMYITNMVYGAFDYGVHRYKSMQVITSSGVGTWGPPLRVGTRSEIVKITFK